MKEQCKKVVVTESRKIRKPMMEKKRRARINDSLDVLKQILLESNTALNGCIGKKNGQRTAKLEKADILEMTVTYLQQLRSKLGQNNLAAHPESTLSSENKNREEIVIRAADSSCDSIKMGLTLIPTKLNNGDLIFVMPTNHQVVSQKVEFKEQYSSKESEILWRPW